MADPALLLLAAVAATWTVDDDGPADFPEPAAAIASPAVQDDDLVVVLPGTYGAFDLHRPLRIVGAGSSKPPHVQGVTRVACDRFVLAHLSFGALEIGPAGSGVLESVAVQAASVGPGRTALLVSDTERLLVSRCLLFGGFDPAGAGGAALHATGSRLVLAEALAIGGDGGAAGGDAVIAEASSRVAFAGGACLGGSGASAGVALRLSASDADARGRASDALLGGLGSGSVSVRLAGGSTLLLSPEIAVLGVDAAGPDDIVLPHAPFAPLMRHHGDDTLGGTGSVTLEGPPGAPALILLSESDALVFVPELADPLWIDPDALLFAAWTNLGSTGNTSVPYSIPPATVLAGRGFRFQAAFPAVPSPDRPLQVLAAPPVEVRVRP